MGCRIVGVVCAALLLVCVFKRPHSCAALLLVQTRPPQLLPSNRLLKQLRLYVNSQRTCFPYALTNASVLRSFNPTESLAISELATVAILNVFVALYYVL